MHQFFHRILVRRHFWRHATFGEVAELYMSRLMRVFGLRLINLFIAIFLYKSGFSLMFIACFYALYFLAKAFMSPVAAAYVARFGPKHGTLVGNLLYIPALMLLTTVPEYGYWAALGFAFFQAWSATIYDLSYQVEFSKVKSVDHAGQEIGFMNIFERIAGGLSPLIGSMIAAFFGPQAAMWVAIVLFAVSAGPLFRTAEPTRLHQKIKFSGFPWKMTWRSMVAEAGVGYDVVASGIIWQLFLAVIVFATQTNTVYLSVGVISSVSILSSIVAAYVFGSLIDKKAGGTLLKYGAIGNSLSHLLRPLVGSIGAAATVDAAANTATTAYYMSFMRGLFDTADRSGFRITYLLLIEGAVNIGASVSCGVFALSLWLSSSEYYAFLSYFVASAAIVMVIILHRFPIYYK